MPRYSRESIGTGVIRRDRIRALKLPGQTGRDRRYDISRAHVTAGSIAYLPRHDPAGSRIYEKNARSMVGTSAIVKKHIMLDADRVVIDTQRQSWQITDFV